MLFQALRHGVRHGVLAKEHWRPLCYMHFLSKPTYSRLSQRFTCEPLFLLIQELHKQSSHRLLHGSAHGGCRTLQEFACHSLLLDCGRRAGREVLSRFPEGTSAFFMAFLISRTTNRDLLLPAVIWICVEGWVVWVVGVWCEVPCLVCCSFFGALWVWLFVIVCLGGHFVS